MQRERFRVHELKRLLEPAHHNPKIQAFIVLLAAMAWVMPSR